MENTNESSSLPEEIKEKESQVQALNAMEVTEHAKEINQDVAAIELSVAEEVHEDNIAETSHFPDAETEAITENDTPITINDEHIEELETEPLENFSALNKLELTKRMEGFCNEPDLNLIKNKVNLVREAFNQVLAQDKAAALSKYLEEGKNADEFEHYPDAIEDRFRKAYSKYSKLKSDYLLNQEKLREENLKIKQEILKQMKNLIQNEENMSKAFSEFHELQARWRNTGAVPQKNANELWMNYKLYIDRFYDFIKINRVLQALDQKKNLEMKLQLCERAEELILEPSLNTAIKESVILQNKWKEIGFISREQGTELWTRFKTALDKIYENKKQYLVDIHKKHLANYDTKAKLCEQAETVSSAVYEQHSQWQEGQKNILELQDAWSKIGPADKKRNEEIWKRFRNSLDSFFKQKDEYYKKIKSAYAANLQGKMELCIQAEGLQDNDDWRATSDELIRLQNEWKKFGHVGSNEKNTKIWNRFRTACNKFFDRKKTHFAGIENEYEDNYKKKLDLISRVEKFELIKEDAEKNIECLKAFQREWSEIGMVPIKKKDIVWDKFRKAIKVHFDALQIRPDFKQGVSSQNMKELAATVYTAKDEKEIVFKMNKLKEEVSQFENNIGFFAKSKKVNPIKVEYEKRIQDSKDEIAKLKQKLNEIKNAK